MRPRNRTTRLPRTARMTGAAAEERATGATANAATRPYRRIRSSEVQMVSTVVRADGPVRGEAAMQNSTAAIAQHVPHDRATVRLKRAVLGAPARARTDTTDCVFLFV